MKVTIETIAEKVGVSKATVSYALTGKNRVSETLRQKILDAAKELDYRPSTLARNLASGMTKTIGLYTPDSKYLAEDIYFNSVLSGILDLLHKEGFNLEMFPAYADSTVDEMLHLDTRQTLDGLLIMDPKLSSHYLDEVKSTGLPFVLIGLPMEIDTDVYYVDFDLAASVYIAVTRLLDGGRKNIGFINSGAHMNQSFHREQGFIRAFTDRKMPVSPLVCNAGPSMADGNAACISFLEQNPKLDGLVVYNDLPAVGAVQALKDARRRIPQDTAIISGGNTVFARISSPSLTSVDTNAYKQGFQSAQLLMEVIGKKRLRPTHEILPVHLVARESG